VISETGYGPSGLPHIGTFGEVARTTMVRHAFRVLTDDKIKTRLIAFSDDMDGLRKVPDNVPNRDMLAQHLGKPLTRVPDPFGSHDSFAAHNNARLRAFLDQFGFDYEFMSSTDCYTSGRFDAALLKVLERFDAVMTIMLPSLREERAETYSPFLPISPKTGIVLQVPIVEHDAKAGTIAYDDPDSGERVTTLVTGGRCKLQWKPDWAMRWLALGVDYEMAGKDLIDSVKLSGEICPRVSTTSSSSTRTGRKSQSRRAMGSPSTSGCATPVRKACRCSCIASQRRRSGSTSTSFRATLTTICNFSMPIRGRA
jgi:lysyl-tRNA synthetase class 1